MLPLSNLSESIKLFRARYRKVSQEQKQFILNNLENDAKHLIFYVYKIVPVSNLVSEILVLWFCSFPHQKTQYKMLLNTIFKQLSRMPEPFLQLFKIDTIPQVLFERNFRLVTTTFYKVLYSRLSRYANRRSTNY